MNSVHILASHFFNIHFSIILSTSASSKLYVSCAVRYYPSLQPVPKGYPNPLTSTPSAPCESFQLVTHSELSKHGSYIRNEAFYDRERARERARSGLSVITLQWKHKGASLEFRFKCCVYILPSFVSSNLYPNFANWWQPLLVCIRDLLLPMKFDVSPQFFFRSRASAVATWSSALCTVRVQAMKWRISGPPFRSTTPWRRIEARRLVYITSRPYSLISVDVQTQFSDTTGTRNSCFCV